jgi:predicted transposase YbfD/YdcC
MESTVSAPVLTASPTSLAAAFAAIPDPRRAASVRYPLPAMLAMAVAAILANHLSVLAIAEWGADQDVTTLAQLGFPTDRTPCQSTLQRLFAKLDGTALSATLSAAFTPHTVPAPDAPHGIAIDGKAQRGRLRFLGGGCPVHVLSAYCHESGLVLAAESIDAPADTDRGEAELTVAPRLLDHLDWHHRVLTGDALFCQRTLCQQVLAAGGDYLVTVKTNQPALYDAIQFLFDPPPVAAVVPLRDRREAQTLDYGHGRTMERRVLTASTDLVGYLDWPGHAQVLQFERTWREHDRAKRAVRYAITSLTPERADAARLLALKRGHWGIENGLHRAKDVNLAEDASLIHVGQGPTVLALLRDAAVNVLHLAGVTGITSRLRRHSQHPERAVALVVGPLSPHA